MTRSAEQRIYNTVQLPALRKTVSLGVTLNDKFVQAPSDFLAVHSLAVILPSGEYRFLIDKDVNFIREAYPSPLSTGVPKYYAIFGPQQADDAELRFIVGPTPDATLSGELQYFYYPESIVTAGTSWLGDNFEVVLLDALLMEAARFMKEEPDIIKNYEDKFGSSLILLKQLGDGKNRMDTYRNTQTRAKVS